LKKDGDKRKYTRTPSGIPEQPQHSS
jgi:hypothetical protein